MTGNSTKDVKLQVRLSAHHCVLIDAAWKAQGFTSRSAFLRHAALAASDQDSQTPDMLNIMRSHRRELGAVGRNINQLAYEMNRRNKMGIPVDPALLVKVEDLEAVKDILKNTHQTLDLILKKAPRFEGRRRE